MSLGLRVLTAIILLGAALGVKLSLDSAAAWRDARDAAMLRLLNAHATPLLDAEGALAAERRLTNGALANLAGTDAATRTAFIGQRARAQSARAQALADFADLPVASGRPVADALAAEREAAGRLDAQRSTIDQILQRQAGAPPTQAEWFAVATAEIEAMTRLRRLIEAAGTDDPVLSRLIVVRDGLAEMAEYAGRERGRINGAIS